MGLDLILAALVVIAAIRGWLKGFVMQAVRLTGLIACVYVADPVRDLAKPRVVAHLPTMAPALVDRLLWWSAAALSYVFLVGVATLIIKLSKRKRLGETPPNRNDQVGGMLFGLAKGFVMVAFLTAGIQKYALTYASSIGWVNDHAKGSRALAWNARYEPASTIWGAHPIQHYVNHIQRMGLQAPLGPSAAADTEALATTEGRPPKLAVPPTDPAKGVEALLEEIRKLEEKN